MAKIACPSCAAENDKARSVCAACGVPLYRETSYTLARRVTIILDACFAVINALAIPLLFAFAARSEDAHADEMLASFPLPDSPLLPILAVAFGISVLIRIAFIVNTFVFKKQWIDALRGALAIFESITLFHFILALYFYAPAVKMRSQFLLGVILLVGGIGAAIAFFLMLIGALPRMMSVLFSILFVFLGALFAVVGALLIAEGPRMKLKAVDEKQN